MNNPNIALVKDKNMLVTVDNWFYAPDGQMYRAVWGKVAIHEDQSIMGIKTNSKSSNWYAFVGDNDKGVLVAGCQIHFACVCENEPYLGDITEDRIIESTAEVKKVTTQGRIYKAQ